MRRLCVIGDPIDHSLSPAIHTAALRAAGIDDATYTAVRIPAGALRDELATLKAAFIGCNVTTPLKEEAAALCDRLDPFARKVGGVNTLAFDRDGPGVAGWNTDGEGAAVAVAQACGVDRVSGLRVAVLGTGPAARAVALGIAAQGAGVSVWGRHREAVSALISLVGAAAMPWRFEPVDAAFCTLPPGVELPADLADALRATRVIVDANYGARADLGSRLGRPVADGLAMLIGQAAASFRIWFGIEPDVGAMAEAANFRLREMQA